MENMNATWLRRLFHQELLNQTSAKEHVFTGRSWPAEVDLLPALFVATPHEEKFSKGRNAPQFDTVTTVRVEGAVAAYDREGISGSQKALEDAEQLRDEVYRRIINNPEIQKHIQQFVTVKSMLDVDSEGNEHIGQFAILFAVEYWQGPEDFYPIEAKPLEQIKIEHKMYPLSGLTLELNK